MGVLHNTFLIIMIYFVMADRLFSFLGGLFFVIIKVQEHVIKTNDITIQFHHFKERAVP